LQSSVKQLQELYTSAYTVSTTSHGILFLRNAAMSVITVNYWYLCRLSVHNEELQLSNISEIHLKYWNMRTVASAMKTSVRV